MSFDDRIVLFFSIWFHDIIYHRVPENGDNYVLKLFLDLDLSVLGWPENDYKEYCERVRAEYQHIEDLDFVNGRIKVLKHLSKVDQELDKNIYFTEWGQKKFQEQALVNMSNEILWLNEIKDKI